MLSFEQARQLVITDTQSHLTPPSVSLLSLADALGHVLAQEIRADREYPPFNRSTRDGYAVRAREATRNSTLRCIGEIKAGDTVLAPLDPGACIQIMTGAAVPPGADAVVMIEFTHRSGDAVTFDRDTQPGQNFVPQGSEARACDLILQPGLRLGFAELAIAAQVGAANLLCSQKPRVAILSTGDEIVPVAETPGPFHIRNSNSVSLAAQVRLAGGHPVPLGNALDRVDDLSEKIELGLQNDILVLSGGVSMGKYDLVETVLKSFGAEFRFDAVAIRPGKPAVFGRCRNKLVFGLPGNPVSTMVTFQLFVTPAIDLLSGASARPLPLLNASLSQALHEKPGLTHFLPARLEWAADSPQVHALPWQGSGDIATLSRANCFLVVPTGRHDIPAGEIVSVLPRPDVL
ncbi:MAG TPA: gephyrin-like molybdotransferase Glp [Candidatus Acidoferrum sp.]|jgi:molybdopterin molybdotransferase